MSELQTLSIPLVEDTIHWDEGTNQRLYRRALLNTLIELKPKYILELGTFLYQSSHVISYYLEKYRPDGKLITVDISEWKRNPIPPNNTYPIMVYPHDISVQDRHGNIEIYHQDWKQRLAFGGNSTVINGHIINQEMNRLDIPQFDFVFLDSDHSRNGFYSDLYISQMLTWPEGYILIDDVFDNNNPELVDVYHNVLKPKNVFYEYNNFDPSPGMALIKNGDLKI